jgi:hypothetical protein
MLLRLSVLKHVTVQQSWLHVVHVIICVGRAVGKTAIMDLIHGKRLAYSFGFLCTFSLPSNFATRIMANLLHPLSITLIANCPQWRLVKTNSTFAFLSIAGLLIQVKSLLLLYRVGVIWMNSDQSCQQRKARPRHSSGGLVTCFQPRRLGFKPGSGHVGFCDGRKWRWGRFSPRTSVSFPCQSTFHLLLHNHLHYHPRLVQ